MEWQFGSVVFDKPDMPTAGWASIEGDQAYRITDQTELGNDIIWWTNFNSDDYQRRLVLVSQLRKSFYLPVKHNDLLKDWGVDPAKMSPDQIAQITSTLFTRIMRMARGLIKTSPLGITEEEFFMGNRLAHDIKDILPQADYPMDDTASILHSGIGFSHFTTTTIPRPIGSKNIMVRRPRLDHAIDVLSAPVPNGPFMHRKASQLPNARELASTSVPVMAQISIHRADPSISPIYGFGVSAVRSKRSQRSWVAHPELAIMAGFSEMEMRGAMIGTSYGVLSRDMNETIQKFLVAPDAAMSWSAGILAETIWKAATVGRPMPNFQVSGHDTKAPETSWRGAWLKAVDKIVTLRYAMALHRAGFAVQSYGSGWVSCAVVPARMEEFVLAAWRNGMVLSMNDMPRVFKESELASHPWGGDNGSKFWATLVLGKNSKALWELDEFPLLRQDEKAERLKKLQTLLHR